LLIVCRNDVQLTRTIVLYDVINAQSSSRFTAFSVGEGWVALSMHPKEYPPRKDYERTAYKSLYSTCLY